MQSDMRVGDSLPVIEICKPETDDIELDKDDDSFIVISSGQECKGSVVEFDADKDVGYEDEDAEMEEAPSGNSNGDKEDEILTLRNELQDLKSKYENKANEVINLQRLNDKLHNDVDSLESSNRLMEVELKTTNDEYQKLQSDYNETCARVKKLESNLQTQRTQHEEHNARLYHGLNDLLDGLGLQIAKLKFILTQVFGTEMETVYKDLQNLYTHLSSFSHSLPTGIPEANSPTITETTTTPPKLDQLDKLDKLDKPITKSINPVTIPIIVPQKYLSTLQQIATEFTTELKKSIDLNYTDVHVEFTVVSGSLEEFGKLHGKCCLVLGWCSGRIGWEERDSLFALREGFGENRYLVIFRKTDIVVSNDKTRKDHPTDVEKKKIPEQIVKVVDIYYTRDNKLHRGKQGVLIRENLNALGSLVQWIHGIIGHQK